MDITLKLTVEETNLLLEGLGELQAKKSLGLIYKVKEQANNQLNDSQQNDNGGEEATENDDNAFEAEVIK